ncbi:hypothetical protein [Sulfobacillus thermosulfidooxidans]|uniref:hypothetical protein n=1 Tax=Sulfobacillus thermosulfidooxidans TaxID=28034 RepID=UPI00030A8C7A|nr:hypothetical protein [Sulfobacillus thermosulfidooxidans]
MYYRELFAYQPEFFRSVRIDRDNVKFHNYLVTPLFGSVFERLLNGLEGRGNRALSLTGPYGTGKSAAMLYAAGLLSSRDPELLASLRIERPDLAERVLKLPTSEVILINCLPARIGPQIQQHLQLWANHRDDPFLIRIVSQMDPDDINSIVSTIQNLIEHTENLVIVLDELGKPLEFAANNPIHSDIFLLQVLAEEASRSSQHPFILVGVLHQSFDQYAKGLLKTQRDEFAKIQGRFEDMAFQLTLTSVMQLIGQMISGTRTGSKDALASVIDSVGDIADSLFDLNMAPSGLTQDNFRALCQAAAPLHPAVTLLLPPLFRHFAQNERSVFGFLGSSEPFGFQQFLDSTAVNDGNPELYTLSHLYDYLSFSIGASMYHGPYGRRWADLDTALHRAGDDPEIERLIKTLGLVDLVPGHPLFATTKALPLLAGAPIDSALQTLNDRSLVIYRRFSDSYRLWSGSDIDIEERLYRARHEADPADIAELLMRLAPPRPIMARKYSMETGTFRWFDVVYIEAGNLPSLSSDTRPVKADGRVYFVLASLQAPIPEPPDFQQNWQVICWIPIPDALKEATTELYYLDWVEANTPEISDDETVAREIHERKIELENIIDSIVDNIFNDPQSILDIWIDKQRVQVPAREFNRFLSNRCETIYFKAPKIQSEFVNRQELTSAVTAARHDVLRRMIENSHEENLGIEKYPPQLPIYLATLKEGYLHQFIDGQWRLVAPKQGPWVESWAEITRLVESQYQFVNEIWKQLAAPPFGIRYGLLPILTLAFILVNRNRLSLLEDQTFVAEITTPVIERMIKSPQRFQIRLTSLTGQRHAVVSAMVQMQLLPGNYDERDLLGLVRPLIAFIQKLPAWTKSTTKLTNEAQKIRHVLLTAREPADLLFQDLPQALGFPTVDAMAPNDIGRFAEQLRDTVQELDRAYPALLDVIANHLSEAFGLDSDIAVDILRDTLRSRALRLIDIVTDLEIKAVALRMTQEGPINAWIEGVATAISGRPPKSWSDRNVKEFSNRVFIVARQFAHYETLASALPHANYPSETARIGLTTIHGDWETIVHPTPAQKQWARQLVQTLVEQITLGHHGPQQLLLLAYELINLAQTVNVTHEEDIVHESHANTPHS